MTKNICGLFMAVFLLASAEAEAQRTCATVEYAQRLEQQDPELAKRRAALEEQITRVAAAGRARGNKAEVITIPVVFHVVYRTEQENISEEQVLSQLEILNNDFRRRNADTTQTPAAFRSRAVDTEFEFCLAHTDPSGYYTSGITRTRTNVSSFSDTDDVKFRRRGGRNAWDATRYLNIWISDLDNNLLGYSSVPGHDYERDGVVIDYEAFGSTGTAKSPFNKGRTLTHEVGHWLGLHHIWGSDNQQCGTDYVGDTPTQESANYNCETYPRRPNSCGATNPDGDMFMNYMDYSNDACMNMFTRGQKTRMHTTFDTWRSAMKGSVACTEGQHREEPEQRSVVDLFPNPTTGTFVLRFTKYETAGPYRVQIFDRLGRKVQDLSTDFLMEEDGQEVFYVNLYQVPAGVYFAVIEADGLIERRQFAIIH